MKPKSIVRHLLLLIFTAAGLYSCLPTPGDSIPLMLNSGEWKFYHISKYPPFGSEENSEFLECQKDDVFSFSEDGSLSVDRGSVRCSITEKNIVGSWQLSEDETVLTLTDRNGLHTVFTIGDIRKTSMVLYYEPEQENDILDLTWRSIVSFGR